MATTITINDLPNEILCEIANKLDIKDVVKLANVNKKFYMLFKEQRKKYRLEVIRACEDYNITNAKIYKEEIFYDVAFHQQRLRFRKYFKVKPYYDEIYVVCLLCKRKEPLYNIQKRMKFTEFEHLLNHIIECGVYVCLDDLELVEKYKKK